MADCTERQCKEPQAPRLITIDELAQLLRVKRSWLYDKTRVAKRTGFPVIRVGKYLRFESQKVMEWLSHHE